MNDSTPSEQPTPADDLAASLSAYGLQLPADQIEQLEHYCRLLWEQNETLNLTRHTTYERFVSRDVVDTWQLSKLLEQGENVLDVGTGGGVPGIPLSIIRPDLQVSLCESVGKKAAAVNRIVADMGLPVAVYHARAEDLLVDFRFSVLVTRAVGPMWKTLYWFRECWPSIGKLLMLKGPRWVEERGEARHRGLLNNLNLRRVASYPIPDTESESVILCVDHK